MAFCVGMKVYRIAGPDMTSMYSVHSAVWNQSLNALIVCLSLLGSCAGHPAIPPRPLLDSIAETGMSLHPHSPRRSTKLVIVSKLVHRFPGIPSGGVWGVPLERAADNARIGPQNRWVARHAFLGMAESKWFANQRAFRSHICCNFCKLRWGTSTMGLPGRQMMFDGLAHYSVQVPCSLFC